MAHGHPSTTARSPLIRQLAPPGPSVVMLLSSHLLPPHGPTVRPPGGAPSRTGPVAPDPCWLNCARFGKSLAAIFSVGEARGTFLPSALNVTLLEDCT